MPRGRVKTSDKVRASISCSKVRKVMALMPEFKDLIPLEDEELDSALVGEVIEALLTIELHLLAIPNYNKLPTIESQVADEEDKQELSSHPEFDFSALDDMDDED